ncbi:hypothetical protein [Ideonella paludis]|uniref:hypothetical protein n=1 Tax=Ideonella paludis TaxID=1233411 RepID=UPI0036343733
MHARQARALGLQRPQLAVAQQLIHKGRLSVGIAHARLRPRLLDGPAPALLVLPTAHHGRQAAITHLFDAGAVVLQGGQLGHRRGQGAGVAQEQVFTGLGAGLPGAGLGQTLGV